MPLYILHSTFNAARGPLLTVMHDRSGSGENDSEGKGPAPSPREVPFAPPRQPVPVFCIKCKRAFLSSDMRYLPRPSPFGPYNEDQPGDWLCAHENCNATGFCFDIWPINQPNPSLSLNSPDFDPATFVDFDADAFELDQFDDDDESSLFDTDDNDDPHDEEIHPNDLHHILGQESTDDEDDDDLSDESESSDPAQLLADFLALLHSNADADASISASSDEEMLKSLSKHIWLDINTDIANTTNAEPKANTEQPDLRNPKYDGDIPF